MRIISLNTRVKAGLPCIAGTRIPIRCIFNLLNDGHSATIIAKQYYPQVSIRKMKKVVESLKYFK